MRASGWLGTAGGRQPCTQSHPAAVPELHQALVFSDRTVQTEYWGGHDTLCSKKLQIWHLISAHRLSAKPAQNTFVLEQQDLWSERARKR